MAHRVLTVLAVVALAGLSGAEGPVALIPQPVCVVPASGPAWPLAATARIHAPGGPEVAAVGQRLAEVLGRLTGITPAVVPDDGSGIVLHLDPTLAVEGPAWAQAEGYLLDCDEGGVRLTARTPHGLFNGAMTLAQLATGSAGGWRIPALTITDRPRFAWRGLLLDVSRHFFTVAEVCRVLDLMALHKFNRFHWHLTDDHGWRIAVKAFPKLTDIGAWRPASMTMGDRSRGDGQPYGGFYTQDDLRTVVAYAAARHIAVIPEIEMPGHSAAAIRAYPELGNDDLPGWTPPAGPVTWRLGVNPYTLAPREATFRFIAAVFDEILPIFPAPWVHIGGDEAPKDQWKVSPSAQALMAAHGLKDGHALQAWFLRRVEGLLAERGKRLVGWDEIQEGGLSPTATMMVWRSGAWAEHALARGNPVILALNSHAYLDFHAGPSPASPVFESITRAKDRPLDLARVYAFEPVPPRTPADRTELVLGCQGQLWSEFIWSEAKLDYQAWPRACALAEVAWSPTAARDLAGFTARLAVHRDRLDRFGVNYRRDDGTPAQGEAGMERTSRPPSP